jgi:GT2 family glycosyltransferase
MEKVVEAPPGRRELDVSVVTYRPDEPLLTALFASFAAANVRHAGIDLFLRDNGTDAALVDRIGEAASAGGAFRTVRVARSPGNVGFGAAHNANAASGRAEFLLVLNPDCILEPGVLDELLDAAHSSPADVAAWELRQIPYEHPKAYDPATLETRWVSGAATLFRRRAFEEVGGFDERIFLYAEDVDLSWRLRCRGWRLLYQPRLAITHRAYREPGEVKPVQVIEGTVSNLCLRARHGGPREVLRGLALLAREIASPSTFAHRRGAMLSAGLRFLSRWPHFARTRCPRRPELGHRFVGWDFETHRDGAFHPMGSRQERADAPQPLVSILIRTMDRPALLRQALASCANQTYRNLEVVVVDDGPGTARAVAEEFSGRLRIVYRTTGKDISRAGNGNLALETARGEWLNFLDDDDLLFADHVEVLLEAALAAGTPAAFGLAWESRTRPGADGMPLEVGVGTRHREAFDRLTLWDHNFLPIQSVLFHRRLYERHGGFDVGMDQLEDWNLWTRYSLGDDFKRVAKTTSKYRVPDDPQEAAQRRERLDRALPEALARQSAMRVSLPPPEIQRMAREFARSKRLARRIAVRVPLAGRLLRRFRPIK